MKFLLIDAVWHGIEPRRLPGRKPSAARSAPAGRSSRPSSTSSCTASIRPSEHWRVNLTYALGAHPAGAAADPARAATRRSTRSCSSAYFRSFAFFLLVGGVFGLPHVETRLWGGLLVTLVISFTGIIGSLPLGILLALGRRSHLPIVRCVSHRLHRVLARRAADHGAVLRDLHAAAVPAGRTGRSTRCCAC